MENITLPALQELLPLVKVEATALRHIRTVFYSATKNHEHLANLSTSEELDPPAITIVSVLPTKPPPPSTVPYTTPNVSLAIPLLSNLSTKPPPARRPTNSLSSLLTLFPPSATCQSCPLLQLHVALPTVRHRLSARTDIASCAISLTQNSLAILLTTGQSIETAGLLLQSHPKQPGTSTNPRYAEQLEPTAFNATGNVAGVWVCGDDAKTATLALHALAAAWWTRRNKRLDRVASTPSSAVEWFERRVWLVTFHDAGRVTAQSGVIAVRNDAGSRFVAALDDPAHPVHFQRVDALPLRSADPGLGHGWRSGWVAAPDARVRMDGDAVDGGVVPARARVRMRAPTATPALVQGGRGDSNQSAPQTRVRDRRRQVTYQQEAVADVSRDVGHRDGNCGRQRGDVHRIVKRGRDDNILTARMRTLNFQRRDPLFQETNFTANNSNAHVGEGNTTSNQAPANQSGGSTAGDTNVVDSAREVYHISHSGEVADSESDGELNGEDTMSMDELCHKYLNSSYTQEIRRQEIPRSAQEARR